MIYLKIDNLKAIGKERPRFNPITKRTYTPTNTVNYEKRIRHEFFSKYDITDCYLTEPVECKIKAFYKIPKSYSRKKRQECIGSHYQHKPDCDNIAKAILDALNLHAYRDDKQVVKISVEKLYSENEDSVEIEIKPFLEE